MKAGDRIELSPGTDRWMMGDRFGTVQHGSNGSTHVRVKLDRSAVCMWFKRCDVVPVEPCDGEDVEIVASGAIARIVQAAHPLWGKAQLLVRQDGSQFWIARELVMLK